MARTWIDKYLSQRRRKRKKKNVTNVKKKTTLIQDVNVFNSQRVFLILFWKNILQNSTGWMENERENVEKKEEKIYGETCLFDPSFLPSNSFLRCPSVSDNGNYGVCLRFFNLIIVFLFPTRTISPSLSIFFLSFCVKIFSLNWKSFVCPLDFYQIFSQISFLFSCFKKTSLQSKRIKKGHKMIIFVFFSLFFIFFKS